MKTKKLTMKTKIKAGFNPQPDPPGRINPGAITIDPLESIGGISANHNQTLKRWR